MFSGVSRAQGGLEYLLLLGGVLVVGFVVYTVVLSGTSATEEQSVIPNAAAALCATTKLEDCNDQKVSVLGREFVCYRLADACRVFDGVLLFHMDDNVTGVDGVINDSSPNDYNGYLLGAPFDGPDCSVPGKLGLGCSFMLSGAHIDVTDVNVGAGVTQFSVSTWIKPMVDNTIVVIGYPSLAGKMTFLITRASNPPTPGQGFFTFRAYNENLQLGSVASDNPYPDEWQHVVGVYDGAIVRLYMNGALQAQQTPLTGKTMVSSDIIRIGKYSPSTTFVGLVDEVAIWHRALSAEEIKLLYNNGKG
ncbi:MAG: LamG domain-containing protein [Candidatus Diapherotrites archaeon]|nr:LamG domain-containing protein [Candidatus Diapherotrites archaeon]